MRTSRIAALTFSAIVLLAFSCVSASSLAQQRQALQTKAIAPVGAQLLSRMPAAQQLDLAISLPLRNQAQLNTLLQQLEDPTNPNYHKYLSVAQFTEQFGPTTAQYEQVIAFAESHGLTVTHTSVNRALLNVRGSIANIEQTLQVTMQLYQHPTEHRTFFAPDVAPTVDSGLPILGISGLTNYSLPHSQLAYSQPGVHSNQTGSGQGGQFLGSDFRAAYYGTGPFAGAGQALALIEFGQWNMADVTAYFASVSQTNNVPIVLELTGGTSAACPGACDDGEEANDVIQILSMAPAASALIVYEDTTNNADIDMFNAYVSDNLAKQTSMSFGIGNGNAVQDEAAFQEMHAQGQNFFLASGDEGANLGDGGWPGYSQYVTDVGGTDLTTASAGGAWSSETGWVGSGTGWCDPTASSGPCYLATNAGIPSYQSAISSIIAAAGGSSKYRNVPDVAAEANTDSWWCATGTCQGGLGGTSLAAPRWAGFLALANEQAAQNGETIGFLNPLVYTLGQGPDYDTAFHDVTLCPTSNNASNASDCNPSGSTVPPQFASAGFSTLTGFDMVTGWGTPNSEGMINALAPVSTTTPYFTLAASPSILNLTPGGAAGTATISLNAGNGFAGTVDLSATIVSAPEGVTAGLNPTSISGSTTSTLTVNTTSLTPPGTLILAVTGTSTTGIQTQPAFVSLALPNFSLSVTPGTAYPGEPSTIYVNQGSSSTATVSVNAQNNFTGSVNLSASALPSGVTATFSPTSTSSSSTMTLTATSAAVTGTTYTTVTGTSGGITPLNAPYSIVSVSAATGTGGSGTPVDLTSAFNLTGIYADGSAFSSSGGMDGLGSAYSSNLLTANRIFNGVQFNFGSAGRADEVYGTGSTIALPSGEFTTLQLLATAINGPSLSQPITVTYTDGTSSFFTQSFSDWCSCNGATPAPGQQPGESFAVVMPHRDLSTGKEDNRVFNLYAYAFVLNSAKTVQSLTLPNNRDVLTLAATLTSQSLGTQVDLSSVYNTAGLYNNGVTFSATGGMDGGGNACTIPAGCADGYSAEQLGLPSTSPVTLTIKSLEFNFGSVNTADCTTACLIDMINLNPGVSVVLPANQQAAYTTLTMLGTGVQGSHSGKVTVTYTTGNPDTFSQSFSDWCNYQNTSGNETVAVGGMSRINSDGTLNTQATCNLYSYTYALDSTRVVQSIALANTDSTNFSLALALTLSGNTTTAPGFTLSASPSMLSMAQGSTNTSAITVSPSGGFNGSVSLAVTSTLPSGVTASFNPTSTSSTSTLTFNASSSATAGTTNVTITGTSAGVSSQTTTISLTVTPPLNFTLSANPTSVSLAQSGSTASTITVNAANGFSSSVELAVTSTLPSGVTASFNPNPATTTSTLTLTASGSAATGGPTTVTVSGTSGSLAAETASVDLTVTPPSSYSISSGSASPATISPGSASTAAITVTPANGYTGTVTLSCAVTSTVTFTASQASCSFGTSNPVIINSSANGSATLTFSTVASTAMLSTRPNFFYVLWLPLPGLAFIGLLGGGPRRKRLPRKLLGLLLLWIVVAGLILLPACGSSGSNGGGGGGTSGTPAGTYTITVNAKDALGVTQSNAAPTVSVTVN